MSRKANSDAVVASLQDALGAENVLTGRELLRRPSPWETHQPCNACALALPGSTDEIAAVLRLCNAAGQTVVPYGGVTGLAQACAILPGVSRSGSTIGAGFLCGLRRASAVRFSFFLGAIAVGGALLLKTVDALKGEETPETLPILVGVIVTFAVSLAAIRVVEILSLKGRFSVFALYCAVVGVLGLIYFTTRG